MKLSNKLFGAFLASVLISLSSTAFAFTACQVTDIGGVDDKGFNATSWKGVQVQLRNTVLALNYLNLMLKLIMSQI